ncbi:MAG: TAXI family TRAP transporter solute-binding subunit [Candidatus Binatia bacterium]
MAIRIGTSEAGGTFHSQGLALAEVFNKSRPGKEKCTVLATSASIDNATRLDRGEIEFGFIASNWVGRAAEGVPPFAKKIALRMVSPANAGPIFFVALAGSPIETVRDFIGKRIAVGPRGSGMAEHARMLLTILGISFDSFTPVYLGFSEGADALIKGEIDAQLQPPIPNRVMTDLSNRADVRVVAYAPGEIENILSEAPFYRRVAVEKEAFRGVAEEISQVGVVNVIVTHERVKEDAVRELAKTVVENLDVLPKLNPLFKGLRDLFEPLRAKGPAAFEFGGVPLHPGALSAYRDAGWL